MVYFQTGVQYKFKGVYDILFGEVKDLQHAELLKEKRAKLRKFCDE
jgi:hypothetical protein